MKSLAFCVGLLVSGVVLAGNSIIVTGASNKDGSSALALDVVADVEVHAVSLIAKVPGVSDKSAELGACTAGLPKGWQATCAVVAGELRVGAFAGPGAAPLKPGILSIGSVKLKGLSGDVAVTEAALGNHVGDPLNVTSSVDVK